MVYAALVRPRLWTPLAPTVLWVRYEANILGDDWPVRFVVQPDPLRLYFDDFVRGLDICEGPPDLDGNVP